ncbi:prolipoprotein diacylglyceryl transferase [Candidatus Methylacidithermus pantelleriae]|uniref:Phosphatidylglycerol--prolipoprotein diacylglyceryl transferase n=1 Tax=Candidatus Methylacidithermus pantelleriae TaxID=2744239 RepID=A0A8J2FUU1_9BACT|nr:prolipoprotein diacylglyceryl transferase [Candidatus Methylacidithermus pantelleriae]CAF0689000.1 Phosphatidylglycerol--prolipoprotein diacylglyceryl transferase [Candidatus Methylacidithermus pantelleriae]
MELAYYVHNLDPYLVRFSGHWGIRYYGLAYVAGYLLLRWSLSYQRRRGWLPLDQERCESLANSVFFLGAVLGGRLGYCLLYDFPNFVRRPWIFFEVWRGGMASHGGILGVTVVLWAFAKRASLPFFVLSDAVAFFTPWALGLGRIANFVNGELWGRPASVPWAVIFPNAPWVEGRPVPRHPSQLYEALVEGLLLGSFLWILRHKPLRPGWLTAAFLLAYGIGRVAVECFREPDPQIGFYFGVLTQGQLLSFPMILAGTVLALWLAKKEACPLPGERSGKYQLGKAGQPGA